MEEVLVKTLLSSYTNLYPLLRITGNKYGILRYVAQIAIQRFHQFTYGISTITLKNRSTPIEWNFAPYYGIILGNEKSQSYRNAKGASSDVAI